MLSFNGAKMIKFFYIYNGDKIYAADKQPSIDDWLDKKTDSVQLSLITISQ